MIVSVNPKPSKAEFVSLMKRTDMLLNEDALKRPKYYIGRNGNPLEDDVKAALEECAKGTPFENTIEKISGQKFPDIVASKFYGVEVKSTKENHWTSTGSSILESSRVVGVERIFMTFGKLGGNPIEFLSRPYEECLYDIAVTHMPRYKIDMRLKKGETIFDKMGISYDELRNMDNPIAPVARYYRSKLREGESLWWASDSAEETVPVTVRLWKTVPDAQRDKCIAYAFVRFPEVFCSKFEQYALWLTTSNGIVDYHIRDQFSASGTERMQISDGETMDFPGVYRIIKRVKENIIQMIASDNPPTLIENIPISGNVLKKKMLRWMDCISKNIESRPIRNGSPIIDYQQSMDALCMLFFGMPYNETEKSLVKVNTFIRPGTRTVTCEHCGKNYKQILSRQLVGHREKEVDICPYCRKSNGESMEWDFNNSKL